MIAIIRAGFVACLFMAAATPGGRAQLAGTGAPQAAATPSTEIRVVNNHPYRIQVVVVDGEGHHHALGRVPTTKAHIFSVEEDLVGTGPFRVKVFADEPVWSAANTSEAIRSEDLELGLGESVYVWVEADLMRSQIRVAR